jgi:protein ImuB
VTPVRTLVVWCPDWPIVAAGAPLDTAAVVLFANRVIAASPAARAEDVHPGLRKREAQSRCPQLVVLERDQLRDARAFEAVAAAVEPFTPRIELTHPGSCAFPTRGPSRYFGGDETLAAQVRARVVEALEGIGTAQVGVADGPFAASLAARRRSPVVEPCVVPPGESAPFLAPLPVTALDRPDLTDVLVRLGLPTLGAFARLAPADVVGRFGAEGEAAHRLARGLDERPPDARIPPPDFRVSTELDPPAERIDELAFAGKALADELLERLGSLGLACTRVVVGAETEHGEHCERLWRDEGTLDAGAVADRVRWQLNGWLAGNAATRPSAGVNHLYLAPEEVIPARGRQLGFWGDETESAERVTRAVARVEGLLGAEAVRVPEWSGGRSPVEEVTLVPAGAVDLTADRPATRRRWVEAPWPGRIPDPSPATVHHQPLPVEVLDIDQMPVIVNGRGLLSAPPAELVTRGGVPRSIVQWAGPWPFDERWWDPDRHRRRARFQIATADGVARLLAVEYQHWWLEATYD